LKFAGGVRHQVPFADWGQNGDNPTDAHRPPSSGTRSTSEALRAFRAKLIFGRLRQHGNSAFEAAASLKISGPTFYYWMDAKRFP
jgi:transcriptional regulator with PAS, ATPase and Fis domain